MAKLLVLSVILVSVILPMIAATRPKPQKNLRIVLGVIVVVILVWTQLCLRVYPALVPLD